MRLYLDQMLKSDVAERLRFEGHDVTRAGQTGRARADDAEILQFAIEQDRALVTLDHHFGDWAILPLDRHPGVIRVSAIPPLSANILDVVVPFLSSCSQERLQNHLVILRLRRARWIDTLQQP